MDTKEYSGQIVLWVGVAYAVSVLARGRTRYKATCMECGLIAMLLVGAAILVPIFLGAVSATARK